MSQVSQKSMQCLINVCRSVPHPSISNGNLKGELQSFIEPILSSLNDKLGDNLVKVRNLAEDSFLALAEHPNFGLS